MKYLFLILALIFLPNNISPAQTVLGNFIIQSTGNSVPSNAVTFNGLVVTFNGQIVTFTHS